MSIKGSSQNAGLRAYRAVQAAKRHATGAVFKALHRAESHLASALMLVSFKKRVRRWRKSKAKATEVQK